jgi:hypothetical protein
MICSSAKDVYVLALPVQMTENMQGIIRKRKGKIAHAQHQNILNSERLFFYCGVSSPKITSQECE